MGPDRISCAAIGCTGGLEVRIIFGAALGATLGARTVPRRATLVVLPTGLRADFDAFLSAARALLATVLAPFLTVRRVVLVDRPAVFAECLLMSSI